MNLNKLLAGATAFSISLSSLSLSSFAAVVWTGETDLGNDWQTYLTLTTDEVDEFAEGDIITIDFTQSDYPAQIMVQDGDWTNIAFAQCESWGGINLDAEAESIELEVTAEIAEQLNGVTNEWGQMLHIRGQNLILTSVDVTSASGDDGTETEDYAYTYTTLSDGTIEITGYTGKPVNIEIPSEIDGKTVTSIGYEAFYACYSLTSVTIPDSVTSIGSEAFADSPVFSRYSLNLS